MPWRALYTLRLSRSRASYTLRVLRARSRDWDRARAVGGFGTRRPAPVGYAQYLVAFPAVVDIRQTPALAVRS